MTGLVAALPRWPQLPLPADSPFALRAAPPGRPAAFIGLDGTLIDQPPYNTDPGLVKFMPAAVESLALLAARGFALVVVTSQSGLARGHFTRTQFARLQWALEQKLRELAGVELLDFLVCPHAPGPDGRPGCLCRKPAPGLLLRAARQHGIALAQSWMVGNQLDDVEAGHRAGCRSVLLTRSDDAVEPRTPLRRPDAQCAEWGEVAQVIGAKPLAAAFAAQGA